MIFVITNKYEDYKMTIESVNGNVGFDPTSIFSDFETISNNFNQEQLDARNLLNESGPNPQTVGFDRDNLTVVRPE